jgi:hypothetical protein
MVLREPRWARMSPSVKALSLKMDPMKRQSSQIRKWRKNDESRLRINAPLDVLAAVSSLFGDRLKGVPEW